MNREYLDYLTLPASLYKEIEEDVVKLFVQLDIHSYPVNPIEIAIKLGYELIPFSKMNKAAKNLLVLRDVDGISYYDPSRRIFVIFYRADGRKERLRFTIGHEIGHIRMNHKEESELARRIADYYAAYLLAPTPWIGHAGCDDYKDVAEKFNLSDQCALRCFSRYENWCNIPYTIDHEKILMDIL